MMSESVGANVRYLFCVCYGVSSGQGQEQLDAARAYSQLAAQGRQNALGLIGNVRHEHVYR